MKWQDKHKMIQLGNLKDNSDDDFYNYKKFILVHLDVFDVQIVDMFITNETLFRDQIIKHKDFYQKVLDRFNEPEFDKEIQKHISFRANIRIGVLEEMIKGEL